MNGKQFSVLLHLIAKRIEKEKDYITELDNVIGDGDHGINLYKGFIEVDKKINENENPGALSKMVGMTLISTMGGASGPLFGTVFLRLANAFGNKEEINIEDFLIGLESGIQGVSERGRSHQGEKTMLDSMIPALEAMKKESNKNLLDTLESGLKAAWEGVEITKTYIATKGRASYVGERSIGHQDPGATSFAIILEEVVKGIKNVG